jgi:hypothetical protein
VTAKQNGALTKAVVKGFGPEGEAKKARAIISVKAGTCEAEVRASLGGRDLLEGVPVGLSI